MHSLFSNTLRSFHLTRIDALGLPQQHHHDLPLPHPLSPSGGSPSLAIALPFSTHPIRTLHGFRIREQPCLACSRLNCSLSSDLHTAELTLPRSTRPCLHLNRSSSLSHSSTLTLPTKKNLKSKHRPHQNRSGSSLLPASPSPYQFIQNNPRRSRSERMNLIDPKPARNVADASCFSLPEPKRPT
jgi:hypothetical protein